MRKSIKRFVSSVLAASMVLTGSLVTNLTVVSAASAPAGNIIEAGQPLATGYYADGQIQVVDTDATLVDDGQWDVKEGGTVTLEDGSTVDYPSSVQGDNNPKGGNGGNSSYNQAGKLVKPTYGAYLVVKPTSDTTLTLDVKIGSGKSYAVMSEDASGVLEEVEYDQPSENSFVRKTYDIKAGLTYYVTSAGSKTTYYAIAIGNYSDTPVETTTEATTVEVTEATTAEVTETTTVEITEATTAEVPTEATTEAPIAPADNQVVITPEYSIDGDTLTVNYKAELNNAGFNHYTMFLTFDPAVLTPVSAVDGDIAIAAKDATGADINVAASNADNIAAQFANVPEAGNSDFEGADGVKTQAELGKVKVAYCIFDKSFDQAAAGALPEFTSNGTLFTVTYKINDTAALNGTVLGAAIGVLDTVSSDMTVHGTADAIVNEVTVSTSSEPGTETTTEAPAESGYVYIPEKDAAADEEVYAGNGVTIVAVQNMEYKPGEAITIGDNTYTGYAQSTNVNTSLVTDPNEKAKSYRLAYMITASEDVIIKVDHKVSSGKGNYILKDVNITGVAEDGTTPSGTAAIVDSNVNNGSESIYDTFTVELKAGETIWVTGQGTNICVFAIDAQTTGTVDPGEPTTEGTTEFTTEEVTGVAIYGDTVTAAGGKATLTFKINENPGVTNYLVFVTYDPTDLIATGGTVPSFTYDSNVVNEQVTYAPKATDPDYAGLGADGVKTAAQLGKIKIAGINETNVTGGAVAFTMDFDVLATAAGSYPVNIEVVAVGNEAGEVITCGSYPGYVVISGGEEPTESTTDSTTEATTDATETTTVESSSETTTSQVTTDAATETTTRRPSQGSGGGGGGGGGGRPQTTTTTEATTEATTDEGQDVVINDNTTIKVPTEKDPNFTGFTDLGNYPWAEDSINKLAELGIISGIGDGQYGPALPCRRGDFAILINRTLGVSVTSMTKNFYDNEDQSKYYYNDVRVGYNAGILSGYGDNNYKPEQYCTREEMAVLIAKSYEWLGNDVTSTDLSVNNKYTDVDNISWWSAPYVAYLTDMGVLNGNTDGTLLPQNYINRAEMAVMMAKVYDYALDLYQSMTTTTTEATTEETTEDSTADSSEETTVDSTEETTVDESSTETTTEAATETTTVVDEDL